MNTQALQSATDKVSNFITKHNVQTERKVTEASEKVARAKSAAWGWSWPF